MDVQNTADSIGERLDTVRKREGFSQHGFAQALGISRSTLQNYLKGDRDIPTSILSILLEKFSVDPSWMIRGSTSSAAMQEKASDFEQLREIGMAIEKRVIVLGLELTPEERWRLISQVYTLSIVQSGKLDTQQATNDFFIDNMVANNDFK